MLKYIAALLIAAAAGWFIGTQLWPQYKAPQKQGEELLRARALEFYKAAKLTDFRTMGKIFTPARQTHDARAMQDRLESTENVRKQFKQETLENLQKSSDAVAADNIVIEREGDWAVTSGESILYTTGPDAIFPLETLVWVFAEGNWWIYMGRPQEIAHYGLPPDFAMKEIDFSDRAQNMQLTQGESELDLSDLKDKDGAGDENPCAEGEAEQTEDDSETGAAE